MIEVLKWRQVAAMMPGTTMKSIIMRKTELRYPCGQAGDDSVGMSSDILNKTKEFLKKFRF